MKDFCWFLALCEEANPGISNADQIFLGLIVPRLLTQFEQELPPNFSEIMDPAATAFLPIGMNMSARDAFGVVYADYGLHEHIVPFFQKYELFLTPTIATPPYGLGIFGPTEIAGVPVTSALEPFFTFPFNMTGQPAASIPVGFTQSGLPVGLQIVGRRFDEVTVLRASARFEEARPWARRWPDLS